MDNSDCEFAQKLDFTNFLYQKRLETFRGKWRYDSQRGANCTSNKLAAAGFVCTATKREPDSACCFVCQHEMLWDPEDDPKSEHETHRPDCPLVKLAKVRTEEDYTVRDWLQLMCYKYSTQKYDEIYGAVENLATLMKKLSKNTEKLL